MKKKWYLLSTLLLLTSCGFFEVSNTTTPNNSTVNNSTSVEPITSDLSKGLLKEVRLVNNSANIDILYSDDYKQFKTSLNSFYSTITEDFTKQANDLSNNTCVSPLSIYMALAMFETCASSSTKDKIVSYLGVNASDISKYTKTYIEENCIERNIEGTLAAKLLLTNSIFINQDVELKQSAIDKLADDFYCYSYRLDFTHDNVNANKTVTDFIRSKTNDLININLEIPEESLFTLLNTFYMKDAWSDFGRDLDYSDKIYQFNQRSGDTKSTKLLQSYYNYGRTINTTDCNYFYTTSENGYKVYFVTPNGNKKIEDVFNASTINNIITTKDYNSIEGNKRYNTRILFPEFEAESKEYINDMINAKSSNALCDVDLSAITDEKGISITGIHNAKIRVDKTGFEGAAITAMIGEGTAMPVYLDVYQDFVVDQSFGYIITGRNDTIYFSGIVNSI